MNFHSRFALFHLYDSIEILSRSYPNHIPIIILCNNHVHFALFMVKREAIVGFCRYWKSQDSEQQIKQISQLGIELQRLENQYKQNQMNKVEFSQEFGIKSLQLIQLRRLVNDSKINYAFHLEQ